MSDLEITVPTFKKELQQILDMNQQILDMNNKLLLWIGSPMMFCKLDPNDHIQEGE